jgi:hypothetical protein
MSAVHGIKNFDVLFISTLPWQRLLMANVSVKSCVSSGGTAITLAWSQGIIGRLIMIFQLKWFLSVWKVNTVINGMTENAICGCWTSGEEPSGKSTE